MPLGRHRRKGGGLPAKGAPAVQAEEQKKSESPASPRHKRGRGPSFWWRRRLWSAARCWGRCGAAPGVGAKRPAGGNGSRGSARSRPSPRRCSPSPPARIAMRRVSARDCESEGPWVGRSRSPWSWTRRAPSVGRWSRPSLPRLASRDCTSRRTRPPCTSWSGGGSLCKSHASTPSTIQTLALSPPSGRTV
jgi:hypothetical protein